MTRLLARLKGERGIAMVTVLLVGAALTAIGSAAAFVAIPELRSSIDDRKGASSLAYAEAGVDRLLLELRRNPDYKWNKIALAGCPGQSPVAIEENVGNSGGKFRAALTVWPLSDCPNRTTVPPKEAQTFAITSTGRQPEGKRVVRQVVKIRTTRLPIGIWAESVAANGTPNIQSVSLVTPGDVFGREKLGFTGTDPYYTIGDFWGTGAKDATANVPAAIHAGGAIYLKKDDGLEGQEHTPEAPLNCTANRSSTAGQSQWDQSGTGGPITGTCTGIWTGSPAGPPPSSAMTKEALELTSPPKISEQDFINLRDFARQSGLYCRISALGTRSCTRMGQTVALTGTVNDSDIAGVPSNFVAYFDFEDPTLALTNSIDWKANVWSCQDDRSVILVVRNGGMKIEANTLINGAVLVPEGTIKDAGTFTINGTIIAKRFENYGNGTFQLDTCWINQLPSLFLDVTPTTWSEIDR